MKPRTRGTGRKAKTPVAQLKAGQAKAGQTMPGKPAGRRLNPQERERQILEGAVAFFAEHGFAGQTRELTAQLGLSKGLLYRYFKSKDDLIDRIYEEVFLKNWNPNWAKMLTDRRVPLIDRLHAFYAELSVMLHDYAFVRLYLYSGLTGASINQRYWEMVEKSIYHPAINEFRHEFGCPPITEVPVGEPEMELMWSLHGSIFYIGMRKWVYHVQVPVDVAGAVRRIVDSHYAAAKALLAPP